MFLQQSTPAKEAGSPPHNHPRTRACGRPHCPLPTLPPKTSRTRLGLTRLGEAGARYGASSRTSRSRSVLSPCPPPSSAPPSGLSAALNLGQTP